MLDQSDYKPLSERSDEIRNVPSGTQRRGAWIADLGERQSQWVLGEKVELTTGESGSGGGGTAWWSPRLGLGGAIVKASLIFESY